MCIEIDALRFAGHLSKSVATEREKMFFVSHVDLKILDAYEFNFKNPIDRSSASEMNHDRNVNLKVDAL